MNVLSILGPTLIPVFVVLVVGLVVAVLKVSSGSVGKYKARSLMTDNELEFHFRLTKALPEQLVFPQVSMQALLEAASADRRTAHADRLRIAQQRVDYVVCDPAGQVITVIELDDRTHDRRKDAIRDKRLAQAGIPTIRYESKQKPTLEKIKQDVSTLIDSNADRTIAKDPTTKSAT